MGLPQGANPRYELLQNPSIPVDRGESRAARQPLGRHDHRVAAGAKNEFAHIIEQIVVFGLGRGLARDGAGLRVDTPRKTLIGIDQHRRDSPRQRRLRHLGGVIAPGYLGGRRVECVGQACEPRQVRGPNQLPGGLTQLVDRQVVRVDVERRIEQERIAADRVEQVTVLG